MAAIGLADHFSLSAPRHQNPHWCVCARNAHRQQIAIGPISPHSNRTPPKAQQFLPAVCPPLFSLPGVDLASSSPTISTLPLAPQLYHTQYLIRSATNLMKPFGSLQSCLVLFFLVLVLGTLVLSTPIASHPVHTSPASHGTIRPSWTSKNRCVYVCYRVLTLSHFSRFLCLSHHRCFL